MKRKMQKREKKIFFLGKNSVYWLYYIEEDGALGPKGAENSSSITKLFELVSKMLSIFFLSIDNLRKRYA